MKAFPTLFSLRFRLLLFALLVTLPVLGVLFSSELEQRRADQEQAQADVLRMVREIARAQERLLNETRVFLVALTHVPQIRRMEGDLCNQIFADLQVGDTPYAFLGVANPQGRLVCGWPSVEDVASIADRPYFVEALETQSFAIGHYQIGRVTGLPVVAIAVPVLGPPLGQWDGASEGDFASGPNIHAVVVGSINLSWLERQLTHELMPPGTTVTLLDREGVVIYRQPDPAEWMGRSGVEIADSIQTILSYPGEGTLEMAGLDGINRLYGFTPLYTATGVSGYVSVGVPTDVAFAQANRRWFATMAWLTAIALLMGLVAWYGGEWLIRRRLERIISVTHRLAAGELEARTGFAPHTDEIGGLGNSVDRLAEAQERYVKEQADTQARLRNHAERLQILVHISNRLSADLELEQIVRTICRETAVALHVEGVSLSLYNPETDEFYHAADVGLPADYTQRIQPVPKAYIQDKISQTDQQAGVMEDAGLIIRPNVQVGPTGPNTKYYVELDMRTLVSIRLEHGNTSIGRLNLHTFGAIREFDAEELALFRGVANQAAQALVNARLYAAIQRNLGRLQALSAVDRAILQTPDAATNPLDAIVFQIANHLEVDAVSVLLLEPDGKRLRYATGTGFRSRDIFQSEILVGQGHAGRAAQENRLEYVADLSLTTDFSRHELIREEGFIAYMAVPMVAQERLLGVIDIFHRRRMNPDSEWLSFVQAMALQTAIAIDHARLFSETRRLLEQTRQQTQQLENVLNTVPEGILFLDREYGVELANRAALDYLSQMGADKTDARLEHLGGISLSAFLVDAQLRDWQEIVLDSPRRIFEAAARPLLGNGDIDGWVIVLSDVTDERTRQDKIQGQERLASVGQLAAGIAHDFNNILTPILIYADMMLSNAEPASKMERHLHEIQKATHRAKELIAHILTFSRQDARSEQQFTHLQPLVEETMKLVRAALPTTIEIEIRSRADARPVMANATQIHQMLMNLSTNAYHAMRETGGRLTVELDSATIESKPTAAFNALPPGIYTRLSVRDTGHGMEPDVVERIFEPFFTTKEVGQGTGMGLAVVHGIVRSHNGVIEVDSKLGSGTAFHIYFPPADGMALETDREEKIAGGGTESVLVVDDESAIVGVIETVLNSLGYHVTGVNSSLAALELFQSRAWEFDLVITDLTMPRLTGESLAEEMLKLRPDLPVLLISGYNESVTQEKLEAIGIRAYLRKPFSAEELNHAIRTILDAEQVANGTNSTTPARQMSPPDSSSPSMD